MAKQKREVWVDVRGAVLTIHGSGWTPADTAPVYLGREDRDVVGADGAPAHETILTFANAAAARRFFGEMFAGGLHGADSIDGEAQWLGPASRAATKAANRR